MRMSLAEDLHRFKLACAIDKYDAMCAKSYKLYVYDLKFKIIIKKSVYSTITNARSRTIIYKYLIQSVRVIKTSENIKFKINLNGKYTCTTF